MTVMTRRSSLLVLSLYLSLGILGTNLEGQDLSQKWRAGLKKVDQELRAGQWAAAEKGSSKLSREILEEAGLGEGAAYSLAVVTAFQAIAEAGLGRSDDAAWHWDVALNLFPDLAKTDLAPYGDAVAALKGRTLRSPDTPRLPHGWTGDPPVQAGPEIERPKVIANPRPRYPKALERMGTQGQVVVSVVIGTDGKTYYPLVHSAQDGGPAMRYVALATLREWRFEPARLEGKPVPVYYSLTVNFGTKKPD